MNDSAKRREELLRSCRRSCLGNQGIPAIHPKHKALFDELYSQQYASTDNKNPVSSDSEGSFFVRLAAAVLIFMCFVWIDSYDKSILEINSSDIVTQIEQQTDFEDFAEVWNEL